MIAFFDTSVHVDILRGTLDWEEALEQVEGGPVRLSPVVASELLRGARGKAARAVERLAASLRPIEPGSWRNAWLEAGRLLPSVFPGHETVGLARLQNDVLLALTARDTGAAFMTRDSHFRHLRRRVRFHHLRIA
jgi:predicted nucleic acid-binding protein